MAVVTTKSTAITNRDAVPTVLGNGRITGGAVRSARGVVTTANGDSIASIYKFCSIPSNAVIVSVRVTSPDIGTTTIADFGLYKTTADGAAVVDADFFASALSLKDGALSKSEIMFESAVITTANCEKAVWDILALSADPNLTYDVCATLTAAADAAAAILVEVDYTV